jgi:uncharacterized protein YecE (DUF72 family)
MRVLTGMSGYGYKEWKGSVYPEDMPARDVALLRGEAHGEIRFHSSSH